MSVQPIGGRRLALSLLLAVSATLLLGACRIPVGGGPQGTLSGDVVAGPTCPVEQVNHPCPPAVVPNREVDIDTADGSVVATTTTDQHGHFSIMLAPGSYVVLVKVGPGMLGMRQITPGNVTVTAGQITYIKIELDTGIR
jgi:hypothetical protein